MAKSATKKTSRAAQSASTSDNKMIDPGRYEVLTYTDPHTGKTVHSRGKGDAVHRVMCWVNTSDDALKKVAKANGIDYDPATYPNGGMAKMALSQKLRAKLRKNEELTIAGHAVKKIDQKVPLPAAQAA